MEVFPLTEITRTDRVRGSVYGSAFGDALGRPTEFLRLPAIVAQYGRDRLTLEGSPALVTDDTEMMLAVGCALKATSYLPENMAQTLIKYFVAWYHLPKKGRAPGATCMMAILDLIEHPGRPWQQASQMNSKGCGANMRVQPVAYLDAPAGTRAGIAQLQAALTHGHPTALAASDLTQMAIHALVMGLPLADLPAAMRAYALAQRTTYRSVWLGNLYTRAKTQFPRRWIARGWDQCLAALDRLDRAPRELLWRNDPCDWTGEGWIAEEALMTGLYCALLYPDDPALALRRAAMTRGDSDSIACLTGTLIGAVHGSAGWPADWYKRIEYGPQLAQLVEFSS